MQKTIKVNIGGKDYSLRGENEEIITMAADEVNSQLRNLQGKLKEPVSSLSLLAALNIAEKYYSNKKQMEVDKNFLVDELSEMVKYLGKPESKSGNMSSD